MRVMHENVQGMYRYKVGKERVFRVSFQYDWDITLLITASSFSDSLKQTVSVTDLHTKEHSISVRSYIIKKV